MGRGPLMTGVAVLEGGLETAEPALDSISWYSP